MLPVVSLSEGSRPAYILITVAGCQIIESGLILAVLLARILFRSRQNSHVVCICAALLSIIPDWP